MQMLTRDGSNGERNERQGQSRLGGRVLKTKLGQRQTMRNATINNDKDMTMTRDDNEDERQ